VNVSLPHVAATELMGFILVLCRVGGLFVLAPIFSGRMIPAHAKLIVAGAISFAIMPLVTHGAKVPTDAAIVPLIMKELLVGLAIALSLGVVAAGIAAAASVLDTTIGFSFAVLIDPLTQAQSAVVGQLYSLFSVLVFLMIGGDHLMIQGLAASYRLVPLGHTPTIAQFGALAQHDLGQIFLIGLEVAAPVLIALALVDVALARLSPATRATAIEIAQLPELVRGYEEIKLAGVERFRVRAGELLEQLEQRSGI
jgi:flagellar biosynthetic protein FliR